MTLADRLNKIIDEQGRTKRAFAKTLGVSENYIYQLTGSQEKLTTISETLANALLVSPCSSMILFSLSASVIKLLLLF